jgi:hypothetical protein
MIDYEIKIFIQEIKKRRSDINSEMLIAIEDFIKASGCKKIKFDRLSPKIMGLSIHDRCIINTNLFFVKLEYFFYILLHEISHQFQYKKYGTGLTLDIYIDEYDINNAVDKLMNLEKTADRLAIKKMNSISNQIGIEFKEIVPRYLNIEEKDYFIKHIKSIREKTNQKNSKTIEEINEVLYGCYML